MKSKLTKEIMCIKLKKNTHGGIEMRTNVELDEVLVKKAMELTNISTKKAVINKALEELIKSNTRKEILKYMDSGIWEGNLNEMRTMR